MKFKPGETKKGGRVKGTPNRTSEEIRQSLLKLFDDNLLRLQKDLDSMAPKDRAYLLINLARHCTAPATNPEKLTEDQLIQIIDYLRTQKI